MHPDGEQGETSADCPAPILLSKKNILTNHAFMHSSCHCANVHKAYKIPLQIVTPCDDSLPCIAAFESLTRSRWGDYSQTPSNKRSVRAWSLESSFSHQQPARRSRHGFTAVPFGLPEYCCLKKRDSLPAVKEVSNHTLRRDVAFIYFRFAQAWVLGGFPQIKHTW